MKTVVPEDTCTAKFFTINQEVRNKLNFKQEPCYNRTTLENLETRYSFTIVTSQLVQLSKGCLFEVGFRCLLTIMKVIYKTLNCSFLTIFCQKIPWKSSEWIFFNVWFADRIYHPYTGICFCMPPWSASNLHWTDQVRCKLLHIQYIQFIIKFFMSGFWLLASRFCNGARKSKSRY